MKRLRQVCLICLLGVLLLTISVTNAAPVPNLVLTNQDSNVLVSDFVEYFEDTSLKLTLEQVTHPPYTTAFEANTQERVNFGRTQSAWWVRFQVQNQADFPWYLLLDSSLGADLDLFILPQQALPAKPGNSTRFYAKPLPSYLRHVWSLNLPKGQTFQIYLRVTNGDAILALPIKFLSAEALINHSVDNYRLISFIYAGMITLGLYQLFMFFVLRESNYLLLTVYIFAIMATIHRTNPVFPWLNFLSNTNSYFYSLPFFLTLIAHAEFTRRILDIKDYSILIDRIYRWGVYAAILGIFVTGSISGGLNIPVFLSFGLLALSLVTSYYIASKGNRIARYFSWIYWLPISIHMPGFVFQVFEINEWTAHIDAFTSVGTLTFILLLSVLQAERVRTLREQMKQVEASSAAKEEFLAIMSHELRTPINSIAGLTTLLKLSSVNDKQKVYLEKLDLATEHMMQLVNHVLDYAKLTSYTFQLKPEPCKLSLAIHSALPLVQQQAEQKGLIFSFEGIGNLDTTLFMDRTSLTQVVLNLLSNAVKYTHEGSIKLKVQVKQPENKQKIIQISVIDTGEGIPSERLESLFDPFTQFSTQTARKGTGLGLAISKRLVAAMGSELKVKSTLGLGSEFSFELQLPVVFSEEKSSSNIISPLTRGLRLLVADNSELNHPEASNMLRQLGAEVQVVPNGQGAILCLQEQDVDIVLVDMTLPELGGLELGRWVRHSGRNPKLPIVAITSNNVAELEPTCRELGINACLRKPLDYQSLSKTLNRALAA